jgi:hypothetical protein
VSAAGESTNSPAVSTIPAPSPIAVNIAAFSGSVLTLAWTNGAVDLYYTLDLKPPVQWVL